MSGLSGLETISTSSVQWGLAETPAPISILGCVQILAVIPNVFRDKRSASGQPGAASKIRRADPYPETSSG